MDLTTDPAFLGNGTCIVVTISLGLFFSLFEIANRRAFKIID